MIDKQDEQSAIHKGEQRNSSYPVKNMLRDALVLLDTERSNVVFRSSVSPVKM